MVQQTFAFSLIAEDARQNNSRSIIVLTTFIIKYFTAPFIM